MPAELRSARVFNNYDFGGALILERVKPYIDGRADMYGDRFFMKYNDILFYDQGEFQAFADGQKIEWLFLKPQDGLVSTASSLGWTKLYGDDVAVIMVRPDP